MKERIIFDNRSGKPLYESYDMAFDAYFQHWSEEQPNYVVTWGEFVFDVKTNKNGITIRIFDNGKKD